MNDITVKVELTACQITNLIDFIEFEFIDSIRRDEDLDNIDYIVSMCDALKALRNEKKQFLTGGERMKIKQNTDKEYAQKVRARLKDNGGYCPCRLDKNEDTKCMCKEFRDQIEKGESGMCHCGLYIAEAD